MVRPCSSEAVLSQGIFVGRLVQELQGQRCWSPGHLCSETFTASGTSPEACRAAGLQSKAAESGSGKQAFSPNDHCKSVKRFGAAVSCRPRVQSASFSSRSTCLRGRGQLAGNADQDALRAHLSASNASDQDGGRRLELLHAVTHPTQTIACGSCCLCIPYWKPRSL